MKKLDLLAISKECKRIVFVKFAKHNTTMVFAARMLFALLVGLLTSQSLQAQFPLRIVGQKSDPFTEKCVVNDATILTVSTPPSWARDRSTLTLSNVEGTLAVTSLEHRIVDVEANSSGVSVVESSPRQCVLRVFTADSLQELQSHVLDSIPYQHCLLQRRGNISLVQLGNRALFVHDSKGALLTLEGVVCAALNSNLDSRTLTPNISAIVRRGVNYELLSGPLSALQSSPISIQEPVAIRTSENSTVLLESRSGYQVVSIVNATGRSTALYNVPVGTLAIHPESTFSVVLAGSRSSTHFIQFVNTTVTPFELSEVVLPDESGSVSAVFPINESMVLAQTGNTQWIVSPKGVLGRLPEYITGVETVVQTSDNVVVNAKNGSTTLQLVEDSWWQVRAFQDRYLIPLLFLVVALVAWRFMSLARKRRHVLRSLYNVEGADPFVFVNAGLAVEEMNPAARKWLGIDESVPLGDMIHVYIPQNLKEALTLVEQTLESSTEMQSRMTTEVQGVKHELLLRSFFVAGVLGRSAGVVLTATDITEELAQRQMQNWAQLAHDMQTSLSIIKLNAQQISAQTGQTNLQEKILLQSNVLISRVKDLVTLGRASSDELLDIRSMCQRVASEFDDQLFKDVEFSFNLQPCSVEGDKPKLERALRNAIENGIRALEGHPGHIRLSCSRTGNIVAIEIEDNGSGMDAITQEQMMQPHFSGFQSMGGTGMGTIIMQHVMKLHKGSLQVESEKGRGTKVRFVLPAKDKEVAS